MSVLIRGMEMPKNCYGCPFFTQVDYWNKNDEADILSKCKRTGEFTWESVNGYLPNCPLIPVPPHGRLGDLDAAFGILERIRDLCGNEDMAYALNWAANIIKDLPTIIPAEEGER